jgi:hypothetical protein
MDAMECASCKKLNSEWEEGNCFAWKCKGKNNKIIGYTDVDSHPDVPKWCPMRKHQWLGRRKHGKSI